MPTGSQADVVAAYIGAAAWVPQVATWAYKRYVHPSVRILPERQVELGFTTFGPIFNLRIAFSADRKDAVIDNLSVELEHESGERRRLNWMGYSETFSEITDTAGNRQTVARDQPAIALKLSTLLLTEKLVRFQEPQYHEGHQPAVGAVLKQFQYLKAERPTELRSIIDARESFDLFEFYRRSFWWKAGRYIARFNIGSPNRSKLRSAEFFFDMSQVDAEALRANVDTAKTYYGYLLEADIEGVPPKPVVWAWRTLPFLPREGNR